MTNHHSFDKYLRACHTSWDFGCSSCIHEAWLVILKGPLWVVWVCWGRWGHSDQPEGMCSKIGGRGKKWRLLRVWRGGSLLITLFTQSRCEFHFILKWYITNLIIGCRIWEFLLHAAVYYRVRPHLWGFIVTHPTYPAVQPLPPMQIHTNTTPIWLGTPTGACHQGINILTCVLVLMISKYSHVCTWCNYWNNM